MNKNGFTLVELIAVIVILGLLALIANSSVVNVVKNSKSDLYNTQLKLIESAAESWGNDNLDKLPNDGECKYLTLANLKNYGLMEEEIINPKTNKEFSDNLYIKINSKVNSSGMLKTTYKVDDNINGCTEALPTVCILAADSEKKGFEIGAKYNCNLGETEETKNLTFYILEAKNNSEEVTLIMNQNYTNSSVAWCSFNDLTENADYSQPGVEEYYSHALAMNCNENSPMVIKLNEIRNLWTKISPDKINIPSANQIANADGINFDNTTGNQVGNNSWLISNLTNYSGYWTSTVFQDFNYESAFSVTYLEEFYIGDLNYQLVNGGYGIRPIITLSKNVIR